MRKKVGYLAIAIMVFVMALSVFPTTCLADTANTANTNLVTEFINQSYVGNGQTQAAPYVKNRRTLVPVRYLADALGATIDWDSAAQTITLTIGSTTIEMTIGSTTLIINGQTQTMDIAPVVVDGKTYVPARWVLRLWRASQQEPPVKI